MVRHKLIASIFFGWILATALVNIGRVEAVVKGDCDVCHVLFPGVPQYELSYTLCIECHSNANPDTIKIFGRSNVPIVFNSTKPNHPLAGGNFHFMVGGSGERKGHNVDGISPPDTKFSGSPPGYRRSLDVSMIGYTGTKTLKCSGSNGCHGNRNIEDPVKAIMGTHHAVDKPLDGSTTAKSYRYLKNSDKVKGVVGIEDDVWNQLSSPEKHNEYSPSVDVFCENCHGDFHRDDKSGPWFRHPTGIPLPKEYDYRQYNPDAPVGRTGKLESPRSEVKPGSDVVICLSCHVAHASPYESMLRWDYDSIVTGEKGNGGCLICHTGK